MVDDDKLADKHLKEILTAEHLRAFKEHRIMLKEKGYYENLKRSLNEVNGAKGNELMLLSLVTGQFH